MSRITLLVINYFEFFFHVQFKSIILDTFLWKKNILRPILKFLVIQCFFLQTWMFKLFSFFDRWFNIESLEQLSEAAMEIPRTPFFITAPLLLTVFTLNVYCSQIIDHKEKLEYRK